MTKMCKAKYVNLLKITLTLFMTIGCNLMTGDFWLENIFPYIFLILIGGALLFTDDKELFVWIKDHKNMAILLAMAVFLLQCMLRRPDLAGSMMVLAKICVKILICWITLFVILLLCAVRLFREKKIPQPVFLLFSAAVILYFYLIRDMDEFSIHPVIFVLLLYLALEKDTGDKREKKIKIAGAGFFACCEAFGYMAISAWNFHGNFRNWLFLVSAGIVVWTFIFYYVLTDAIHMLERAIVSCPAQEKLLTGKMKTAICIIMLGIRVFFWMNWFPGVLCDDSCNQIKQAIGTVAYNNHQPWLITMLLKAFLFRGGGTSAVSH